MLNWLPPRRCLCRHVASAHQHWRPGSDCAACECPGWAPGLRGWLRYRRALARLSGSGGYRVSGSAYRTMQEQARRG
jgi:hypothetical protein